MNIKIPNNVKQIMSELTEAGFQAYIVGGCVRDALRGVEPNDWDITTNATPEQMREVFGDTEKYTLLPTGEQYGTMTVMLDSIAYEVTTYRADGDYSDGRRPDDVTFSQLITDDLSRRDFTINAMAYNETEGLIDIYGGYKDLQNRIVQCVGKSEDRFNEDALRIMRAIRFAVTLDFNLSKSTVSAIYECGRNLKNVAQERKTVEFVKTLKGLHKLDKSTPHYAKLCRMVEYIIKRTIPEFLELSQFTHNNPYHYTDIFTHTTDMLFTAQTDDIEVLLIVLFHDIGKMKARVFDEKRLTNHYYKHEMYSADLTREILERMRFDSKTIERVVKLVDCHDYVLKPGRRSAKRLLNKLGHDLCLKLFEFQLLDKKAHRWGYEHAHSSYESWVEWVTPLKALWVEIIVSDEAFKISDLAINGGDLIANGFKQGKEIGETLNRCLEYVIDNPEKNTREDLLEFVLRG